MAVAALKQKHYDTINRSLDEIIEALKTTFGMSEDEARTWLRDYMQIHYFPVHRALNSETR